MTFPVQKNTLAETKIISASLIAGLGIVLGLLASFATRSFLTYAVILGLIFVTSLLLPKYALIPFALAIYATSPVTYIAEIQQIRTLSPIFVVLVILVARNSRYYDPSKLIFIFFILVVFLILSMMSINSQRSIGWSINFILAIAVIWKPIVDSEKIWTLTFQVAKRLTFVLAVIGLLEFFLKTSLIFGHYGFPSFINVLWNTNRSWSIYRLTTTLGHPLNNGLFFCTLALIMFTYAYKRQLLSKTMLPIALALILLVLSGSRNSMLAFAVGVPILLLTETDLRFNVQFKRFRNILLLLFFGLILIQPVLSYLSKRNNSSEGSTSFAYRFKLLSAIQEILPSIPATGFGPGTSSEAFAGFGQKTILENGVAQLILSLGLFIALIIITLILILSLRLLARNPAYFVLAIPTITIFLSTNFLDDNFPYVAFIGLIFLLTKIGVTASEEFAENSRPTDVSELTYQSSNIAQLKSGEL